MTLINKIYLTGKPTAVRLTSATHHDTERFIEHNFERDRN